jgi:hypothetical protein
MVPLLYPLSAAQAPHESPLGYPVSTPEYPRVPPRVGTSAGADPHVVFAGAVTVYAAEDVDGAGGVDHGRVVTSRSPSRAGRTIGEGDTCGHEGDRPMKQWHKRNHARAAARAS